MEKSTNKKKAFIKIPNPYFESARSYYNQNIVEKIKRLFESSPPEKILFIQGKQGTGKSSTLKQLKSNPHILGELCIPIYIDLKDIFFPISPLSYNILFELYRGLTDSLDKSLFPLIGIELDMVKENTDIRDLDNFFNTLERLEKEHRLIKNKQALIILLFDDFDKAFEMGNVEEYYNFIEFLKKLAEQKSQIRILLSRSGEIPGYIWERRYGDYLKKIQVIKMENLEPGEFYNLIREPVKTRVTYSESALKEIRRITGGNLYCQQLLCHNILERLNVLEKEECDKDDVDAAVTSTINAPREDFEHFWKGLQFEEKMICSALNDEATLTVSENYYMIKEQSLLENIFEPQTLNKTLKQLYDNDFIHKPYEGRRFEYFPFKVPLFGFWLKQKYPFLKLVGENIDTTARQVDINVLGKIIKAIPEEYVSCNYLTSFQCMQKWFEIQNILEDKGRVDRGKTRELVDISCQVLGLTIKAETDSRSKKEYSTIDVEKLNIGNIKEAAFHIQDRIKLSQSDTFHIRDILVNDPVQFRPCIYFCFKRNEELTELEDKTFLNMIVMEGQDIKNILFSLEPPAQLFKEFLLQRLSTSQINPYHTDGPTITTFYGRNREIQRMMNSPDQCFIIVGARRIGKSSLILRVKKELDKRGVSCIYKDLEYPPNPDYKSFLADIGLELEIYFKKTFPFNSNINDFVFRMKKLNLEKHRLVIILDEIDALLEYDRKNGYELIKSFRSLFHEHYCQFIFSGFEVLYNSKRNRNSPLYNFGEEIQLGPLDVQHAFDLITEPMANIGIKYSNLADRDLILDYTSCHPNLLQVFCKKLIEKIAERGRTSRTILRADILDLFDVQFENYIMDDFYMFFDDLDNIEKLFLLIFSNYKPGELDFYMTSITKKLGEYGINLLEDKIHKTIQRLKLKFILKEKAQGRYDFALSHFPSILNKRKDPNLLENLVERIKEGDNGNAQKSL